MMRDDIKEKEIAMIVKDVNIECRKNGRAKNIRQMTIIEAPYRNPNGITW
jgi:hypothetical protein